MVFDVAETKRQIEAHFTPLRDELARRWTRGLAVRSAAHEVDEVALRHPPTTQGQARGDGCRA